MASVSNPLVSIVIINYNYARFITDAVDSALTQTYPNIEVIVIDDGSTDDSVAVIKNYQKDHKGVRLILQENQGVVKTRNRAIKEAKGSYFIQLDADDYLDKDYVASTLQFALKNNLDLVYTDFKKFDQLSDKSKFPEYSLERLKNENFIHISCLVRKGFIGSVRFDEYLSGKSHEDWDFFLALGVKGMKAGKCNDTYLHYRIHGTGRNGELLRPHDKDRYVGVYLYIMSKYKKTKLHEDFDYLLGATIGAWYRSLYNEYEQARNDLFEAKDRNSLLESQVRSIESSMSYRIGRKITAPIRVLRNGK